jgi:glucose/arabinose dehydrogenase
LFTAHSSLLDLVFYEADQFPPEYKGSLFVALKGSWNRSIPTGYKVVRVPFKDGGPEGYYENFATGFWIYHWVRQCNRFETLGVAEAWVPAFRREDGG